MFMIKIKIINLLKMKLRTQRVHQTGTSNRESEIASFTAKDVFESSYVKSKSSYYKTAQSLPSNHHPEENKTALPFKGHNVELDSLRWNSVHKRKGKDAQWRLEKSAAPLDHSSHLNEQVSTINKEFKDKNINTFKLNQLKRTFVKNNKQRRHLREYFNRFAKEGKIGTEELQAIVAEYGYDVNLDEAKILCRLTGAPQNELNLNQFVELMTRENVHFSTLKLDGVSGQPKIHFPERIHLVIRNKFTKLMEAFKIYRSRDQPIDQQKYDKVMKKLDINDLVISQAERQDVFDRFKNKNNEFNAQALFSAVIEQQSIERPTFPPKLSDFDSNLRTQDQVKAKMAKKTAYFDFKRTPNIQFEGQFFRAQNVIKQLKKLGKEGENILKNKGGVTREQLIKQTQTMLRSKGINFIKEDYDCYSSYFNYNNADKITHEDFKIYLEEPAVKAEARFDRRLRALAPLEAASQCLEFDDKTALQSLEKVRSVKLDPETKTLFKEFDKDKDGYLSRGQLKNKFKEMAVLEGWQVQNLTNYFDSEGKGYVNYCDFAKKYDDSAAKTNLNYYVDEPLSKLKSHSDWLHTKKSIIKDTNTHKLSITNKYSAWPDRLRHTDMSMIQPSAKAGQYISEMQRFNSTEKHDIGQQHKQERLRLYQNKLNRLSSWNDTLQQRVKVQDTQHQNRSQANDYSLRLTKQNYEQRCHRPE